MDYLRDIRWRLCGQRFRNADELLSELVKIPWFRNEVRDVMGTEAMGKWVDPPKKETK